MFFTQPSSLADPGISCVRQESSGGWRGRAFGCVINYISHFMGHIKLGKADNHKARNNGPLTSLLRMFTLYCLTLFLLLQI